MTVSAIKALLEARAKAVAAAIVTAVVAYASTAITHSTVITAHGLEAAAVGAVVAFVGVHRVPNKPAPKPRHSTKPAK